MFKIVILEETNSTMDLNYPNNTLVIAKKQTKGRGTHNRTWNDGEGNLMMTLILDFKIIEDRIDILPMVIANSMIKSIGFGKIKWPNDLMINDKKCGGVLVEIKNNQVKIGIGINIKNSPIISEYKITCLNNHINKIIEPIQLGKDISEYIVNWANKISYKNNEIKHWKKNFWWNSTKNGKPIRILEDGRLVILTNNRKEKILSFRY